MAQTGKLKFKDEVETVKNEAAILRSQGVDIIIVLSHCGLNVDYKIAQNAGSDIDVIVGGHSHTFMFTGDNPPGPDRPIDEYPAIVEQGDGHKVNVFVLFILSQLGSFEPSKVPLFIDSFFKVKHFSLSEPFTLRL